MGENRGPPRPGSVAGPASGARLVIHLLGEAEVSFEGRLLPDLTTPRMQRMLALLALASGARLRRDRVAYQLWPDSSEAQARTNLRKLLHDLRQPFAKPDDFLEVGGQTIGWNPDGPVWVDVVAFTDALSRGDAAAAVRHYGGDLLPACYDDWVTAERERLRSLAIDALTGLALEANEEGRDNAAVDHARHLLRIDLLHEPAYRVLMEALARRGDRNEALRTYHRCVDVLEQELGVGPDSATVGAYSRLRAPSLGRQGTGDTTQGGSPLVGRDAEWRTAHHTWCAAAQGAARFLLVSGEAGVGKTRLVEELAERATAEGYGVARTRAYEAAGSLPWGPVADWLRSDVVRVGLERLDPVWLTELVRLLPELRRDRPGLPETSSATDAGQRQQLLDAVRRGLLACGRPLLLVVDDLQWCDPDTLELCAFLLQTSPQAPLLLAGTCRDEEMGAGHPVTWLQERLARERVLTHIALERLDPRATAEIAALVGRRPLDDDMAVRLWEETEGNPLFVVEAVHAGFGTDEGTGNLVLTPTVQAVIGARLRRLSPNARRLVDIAATIGRDFTPGVLASAAEVAEDELAEALDELWRRHIVRERGAAYDFSHDKLREVALEAISPARRRKLHLSVALSLERHHAGDLGAVSARLGSHYQNAGLDSKAVEAYERAAEHAYRVFALDDGISLLQEALRLLDRSPQGPVRDEIELRLRSALGVPLAARQGYGAPAVKHSYERALTLHRRLGHRPSPSVLRGLALQAVVSCDFHRAAEMGHELLAAGRTDHTALVEGDYVLGVVAFWRGNFSVAEAHLERALARYRPEDAPLHITRYVQDPKGVCLSRLALTQLFRGLATQAGRTMREALRFAAELDHPMTTGYVRAFDSLLAALDPDDYDLAASVAALEAVTSEMRIGYFETLARLLGGWRDVLNGELAGVDAMQAATRAWKQEQQLHLTLGLSLLARGHLRAGDLASGRAVITDAVRRSERTGQAYLLAELLRIEAELLAAGGEPEASNRACRRAVDVAVQQGSPWLRERALATLARIASTDG